MIIVYEANSTIDANIVQDILAMQGIESHIMGGLLQGGIGELQPFGLIKVMADNSDYEAARKIIAQWENEIIEPEEQQEPQTSPKTNTSNERNILIGGFILSFIIGLMYLSFL